MQFLTMLEQIDGAFGVQVPDLAISTWGSTTIVARQAAIKAIMANLEAYDEAGQPVPPPQSVASHLTNPEFKDLLFAYLAIPMNRSSHNERPSRCLKQPASSTRLTLPRLSRQFRKPPTLSQQLNRSPLLTHPALLQHIHIIRVFHHRVPMRNHQDRRPRRQPHQRMLQLHLRRIIQVRRSLIQQQQTRTIHQYPGNLQPLPLPLR